MKELIEGVAVTVQCHHSSSAIKILMFWKCRLQWTNSRYLEVEVHCTHVSNRIIVREDEIERQDEIRCLIVYAKVRLDEDQK